MHALKMIPRVRASNSNQHESESHGDLLRLKKHLREDFVPRNTETTILPTNIEMSPPSAFSLGKHFFLGRIRSAKGVENNKCWNDQEFEIFVRFLSLSLCVLEKSGSKLNDCLEYLKG